MKKFVHDLEPLRPYNDEEKKLVENLNFYRGKGGPHCDNTGFKGRVGIYEALEISPALQRMIVQDKSAQDIQEQAYEEGLVTLKFDGILKAAQGLTTLEEVYKVAGV